MTPMVVRSEELKCKRCKRMMGILFLKYPSGVIKPTVESVYCSSCRPTLEVK